MAEPLLKLDGVTKVFLTDEVETHALSGIHMEIQPGEYVSMSGPSGCGKSTLLRIFREPFGHRRETVQVSEDHCKFPNLSLKVCFLRIFDNVSHQCWIDVVLEPSGYKFPFSFRANVLLGNTHSQHGHAGGEE